MAFVTRRWTDQYGELRRAHAELDAWVDAHSVQLDRLAELTPDAIPSLFWGYGAQMMPHVLFKDLRDPTVDYLYSDKPRGLVLCRAGHEPDLDVIQRHTERYERDDGMVLIVLDRDG